MVACRVAAGVCYGASFTERALAHRRKGPCVGVRPCRADPNCRTGLRLDVMAGLLRVRQTTR